MARKRVMTIFGTRPEAIKMAPVVKALEEGDKFDVSVCVTAQHRQMLDQVMELFRLTPQYDLDIMRERQSLSGTLSRALAGLEDALADCEPDLVLVHGDTLTTFAGSLAAFYRQIPVGHVEAGLRTFDKYFPFPEEINRRLAGVIADLHFAPTSVSRQNLLNEGTNPDTIYVTGNTAIDALKTTVRADYRFGQSLLNELDFTRPVIVVELHRRENWETGIASACRALKRLVAENPEVSLVFPVHLNPIVRETVFGILDGQPRVYLLDPLDTAEYHNLVSRAHFIVSDSGGIQEEAPALGKPVLLVRTTTERPEAVAAGTVKLVGVEEDDIYQAADQLLNSPREYLAMSRATNPYGDGQASLRIREAVEYYFGLRDARPADFIV